MVRLHSHVHCQSSKPIVHSWRQSAKTLAYIITMCISSIGEVMNSELNRWDAAWWHAGALPEEFHITTLSPKTHVNANMNERARPRTLKSEMFCDFALLQVQKHAENTLQILDVSLASWWVGTTGYPPASHIWGGMKHINVGNVFQNHQTSSAPSTLENAGQSWKEFQNSFNFNSMSRRKNSRSQELLLPLTWNVST